MHVLYHNVNDFSVICFSKIVDLMLCYVDVMTVGASTSHDELKFLYEGHESFSVLPTYAVIASTIGCLMHLMSGDIAGFRYDPAMVVFLYSINLIYASALLSTENYFTYNMLQ